RGAGAEGKSRAADRGTAGRAGGRRRLRAHRSQRRLAAGLPARHVHPVAGRPAHPCQPRLRCSNSPTTLRTLMKISARNKLKGRVVEVKKGATTAHVKIDIGGQTVTAAITNEAVDELKLAAGQQVYAVIKASDVMVGID